MECEADEVEAVVFGSFFVSLVGETSGPDTWKYSTSFAIDI